MTQKFKIFALSDGTGELAYKLATAVVRLFPDHDPEITRFAQVKDEATILKYVSEAKKCHAVIVFTFHATDVRQKILEVAKKEEVVAIDIMGPTVDALKNYFHILPSPEPQLHYKQTRQYFKRTEAVEYTMKHDSALGIETLQLADVILMGVSRSSKSPLSMYLACQGYRCANIPIILGHDIPPALNKVETKKLVGLIMDPSEMQVIRSSRMHNLGRSDYELYADEDHIKKEISHAKNMYLKLNAAVINVSGKAIEEVANEICQVLGI